MVPGARDGVGVGVGDGVAEVVDDGVDESNGIWCVSDSLGNKVVVSVGSVNGSAGRAYDVGDVGDGVLGDGVGGVGDDDVGVGVGDIGDGVVGEGVGDGVCMCVTVSRWRRGPHLRSWRRRCC